MYKVLLELHSKMHSSAGVSVSSSITKLYFDTENERDVFLKNLIKYENVNGIDVSRVAHVL